MLYRDATYIGMLYIGMLHVGMLYTGMLHVGMLYIGMLYIGSARQLQAPLALSSCLQSSATATAHALARQAPQLPPTAHSDAPSRAQ